MTADSDKTVLARVANLAETLEAQLGVTPIAALRHDFSLPAQIKRLENVVPQIASLSDLGSSTSGRTLVFSVQDPENLKTHGGRGTQSFLVWLNDTGQTYTLTRIVANADVDNYTFLLLASASETDVGVANDSLIATVACSTDGTSGFSASVTSFITDVVEDGQWLIFEHSAGTAESVSVQIEGVLS